MQAAKMRHEDIVKLLLQAGADPTISTYGGAIEDEHGNIIREIPGDTALDFVKERVIDRAKYPNITLQAREKYKEIGRMLLKATIDQLKQNGMANAERREILESKKTELREKMQGLPEDVIKYTEQFFKP